LTILLGRRLVWLNYNQSDQEANLRSALIHVRENAESLPLARHEKHLGVRLLTSTDPEEARTIAAELDRLNEERRAIEMQVCEQALEQAGKLNGAPVLTVMAPGWHPGVIGIVASRLVEEAGVDRFRFSHALVRQTLYERLSTSRRLRLHRRIAHHLEDHLGAREVEMRRTCARNVRRASARIGFRLWAWCST